MRYSDAGFKAVAHGIAAIADVKRRVPSMNAVLFGPAELTHVLPPDTVYLRSAPQRTIVDRVFNDTRVLVNSSVREGFRLCSAEAMACGCALVTTANGRAREYAVHGETALVSEPGRGDVATMADHIETLLCDDWRRVAITWRGVDHVAKLH